MKKFTKICLIASALLILIGGTICVLGAISGGWELVNEMDESGSFWRFVHRLENSYVGDRIEDIRLEIADEVHEAVREVKDEMEEEIEDAWEDAVEEIRDDAAENWEDMEEAREDMAETRKDMAEARKDMEEARNDVAKVIEEEFLEEVSGKKEDTGIGASQVKSMRIEIGGAALCLMESGSGNFEVAIDGKRKYQYYESKGAFCLEGEKNRTMGNNNERVYLYIPKGKSFDEVEIRLGGGMISIGELDADEVEINVGAGIVSSGRISCHELDVEVGAGEAVLEGIEADKMDIDAGMGTVYVKGRVAKEIDVKCGMGVIAMELDNAETDFNYEIECAAGGIALGGKTYSALAKEVHVDNRAAGECSLECSMGSIEVVFAK